MTLIASERDHPDVARRRAQWQAYQGRIDPPRLVFIDETWTKTIMAPLRDWGPRGERLKARRISEASRSTNSPPQDNGPGRSH